MAIKDHDLSVNFCDGEKRVKFRYPWGNASGIWANVQYLEANQEYMGFAVTKSTGTKEKMGNESPTVHEVSPGVVINAVGLPNPGRVAKRDEIDNANFYIPVIASIFGNSPEEIAEITQYLNECKAIKGFKVNISCPNIEPDEQTGIAIGKVPELTYKYIRAARDNTEKIVIAKHTPATYIWDIGLFDDVVYAAEDGGADAHSAINTIPGAMAIDIYSGRPILSAGRGGLSGRGIKPIGIGCVYRIREISGKPIIGMGGIETAEDVVEYMRAGASAVAVGTGLKYKQNLFSKLTRDLHALMDDLDVGRVSELVGVVE